EGVRGLSGEHLDVDAMSDGTRDQLFLALRLAYIENHCDSATACPVILDDVLMAFDDERTGAALRALRDLSLKTQVLVFTHHAHHVELAEKVLGNSGFQLHDLSQYVHRQIGCGEEAKVALPGLVVAKRKEAFLLQSANQEALKIATDVAYLIEKESVSIGNVQDSVLVLLCAGEST